MNSETSNLVNKILLGIFVFILTIIMNTTLRPTTIKPIQTTVATTQTKTYVKKETSGEPMMTNNQKAALFLAFPLGGMIWLTGYTLIKNRQKLKKLTKIEREPRVVF